MNRTNKYLLLFLALYPVIGIAQQIYIDHEITKARGATLASMTALIHDRAFTLRDRYRALERLEREFMDDKVPVAPNLMLTALQGFVINETDQLQDLVTDIEDRIAIIRLIPRHPGLAVLEDRLNRERGYLDRITDDEELLTASPRTAGGEEYPLRYHYNRFLRLKKIKSNLYDIKYKVNNLNRLATALIN